MKTIFSVSRIVAMAALLALSVPMPSFSQMMDMPMNEHGEGHGRMMEMGQMDKMDPMMVMCIEHADEIGLTDEQIIKIMPLHRDMQKNQAGFETDLNIAEIDLMGIMNEKDFNLEKAGAAIKKMEEMKTAHHLERLKAMKEIRTILTDEQFKKMMSMMADDKKPEKMLMK